jgi:DNA primase
LKWAQVRLRGVAGGLTDLKKVGIGKEELSKFGIGFMPTGYLHALSNFMNKKSLKRHQVHDSGIINYDPNDEGMISGLNAYSPFEDRLVYPLMDKDNNLVGIGSKKVLSFDKLPRHFLFTPEPIGFDDIPDGFIDKFPGFAEIDNLLKPFPYSDRSKE